MYKNVEAVTVEMVSEGGVGAPEATGTCSDQFRTRGTAHEMAQLQEGALHINALKGDI